MWETVFDVIGNVDSSDPKFVGLREASQAIAALKLCPRRSQETSASPALAGLLVKLPLSRYALRRANDLDTWDFFEVVEREDGRRYVNQLLGSPADWNRKMLTRELQFAAATHILEAPKASAIEYARQHGRCAVCNSHLSDPASIARSMGPVCARRF